VNFDFDEDQQLLRDTVRRFLGDRQPLESLRASLEEPELLDRELWRQGCELGYAAMLVPEQYEGGSISDQPLVDLLVYAEELGRMLNPGPLLGCNVAADAIARSGSPGLRASWLAQLASGDSIAALGLSVDGLADEASISIRARRRAAGTVLDGAACFVHEAANADLFVLVALVGDEPRLVAVPAASVGLQVERQLGIDLTKRHGAVRLNSVVLDDDSLLADGQRAVDRALAVATVVKCAEATGAASILFDKTVTYLRERVQFGRTIASYQAIKHRLADLAITVEAMRAATYYAALSLADGSDDASEAIATAGSYVPEAFARLAGESLQLHGGIGFTWEHDVQLFVRRASSERQLHGDPRWHRARLLASIEPAPPGGQC
jgi:alkylation response protein AidB-like acyl-CoA dehydrogenase